MLPPRAVIFDMDGVIVDSEPLHERAFRAVFAELGFAETHGIDFPAYYGRSDLHLWRDFIDRHRPPQPIEELLTRKERRFEDLLRAGEPIFPGLPELLAYTAARCLVGLASGSRHATINSVLALRHLRRHFRAVVSSEDVPRGKPAPDVFLRAAELLGVAPAHCVVVEDSEAGVTGACAAGMTVIAITNTLPAHRLSQAHYVVGTCAEIQRALFPLAG